MSPPRRIAARSTPRESGSRRSSFGGRTRFGSVERPVNARLVRGTWLLVALPLLLAAFTVGRPQPLPPPTLPAAFDAQSTAELARELARDFPDRSPGSAGSLGAAQWFADQLRLYGLGTESDRFTARVPGRGRVALQNLVAVIPGPSSRAIVFMAHRDNTGEDQGTNDNASGTAALIELARAFAPVAGPSGSQATPAHTLVFVSTDGGAYGALGASRFAATSRYRNDAVAVVSLDAIAGNGFPRLVLAGDEPRSPAPVLVRTAATRILEESGDEPRRPGALAQLLDLGFPFTLGEQGSLIARGIPGITLTTGDERPAAPFAEEPLNVERLGEVGRAAQNLLGSLDAGIEIAQGTTSYVYLGRRLVRGWALELALFAALLPFLIATVDLFARCRRRRIPLGSAARSLRSRLGFWAYAGVLLLVGARLGLFPDAEPRPLPTHVAGALNPPAAGLAAVAVLLLGGWLVGRQRLLPQRPAAAEEALAGYTTALLALALLTLIVVATNPFALVFVLPSLYSWLWLPQTRTAPARVALLAGGLLGPALLVVSFARRYSLDFDAPWYLLSLVGVGYVPWLALAVGLAWLAIAAQLSALAVGRYAPYPDVRARTPRGPLRRTLATALHARSRAADKKNVAEAR
ncbi:MAG: M28 family peptidase [Gaiellaceae bacterium MAG52_C11]|nr:M28 family peptidase [Candidatus Gaiellasilicea maunaloa]